MEVATYFTVGSGNQRTSQVHKCEVPQRQLCGFASGHGEAACYDFSIETLERTGLLTKANVAAEQLTLLERKRLELARALATRPTKFKPDPT